MRLGKTPVTRPERGHVLRLYRAPLPLSGDRWKDYGQTGIGEDGLANDTRRRNCQRTQRSMIRAGTQETEDSMETFLRSGDVAELLCISRSRVYRMVASGSLRSIRVGRSVRISTEALEEWIKRSLSAADSSTATPQERRSSPRSALVRPGHMRESG